MINHDDMAALLVIMMTNHVRSLSPVSLSYLQEIHNQITHLLSSKDVKLTTEQRRTLEQYSSSLKLVIAIGDLYASAAIQMFEHFVRGESKS